MPLARQLAMEEASVQPAKEHPELEAQTRRIVLCLHSLMNVVHFSHRAIKLSMRSAPQKQPRRLGYKPTATAPSCTMGVRRLDH